MKHFCVKPATLKGTLSVPPSKSQTLRAILFGALAKGKTTILNPLNSPDTDAMIDAMCSFGVRVNRRKNQLVIHGTNGKLGIAANVIDAGNSGIVYRFVSAVAALSKHPIVITGDLSIRFQRPIQPLLDGLSQLGVRAISTKSDGFAPVIIEGPFRPGKARVSGRDSQPISGLLIAAAFSEGPIELVVRDPGEKPFVQLTLDWFDRLGVRYQNQDYSHYTIDGNQTVDGFSYSVPGDFSSAAFPMIAALITGSCLTIENLDFSDGQGDKELISVLQKMGAEIHCSPTSVTIGNKGNLQGIEININPIIDAITPLAVLGCFAKGKTVITHAKVARTKECDRISATVTELKKMGADIEERPDGLVVRQSSLQGSQDLFSHDDHRMALALSVAALAAKGESQISSVDCIKKTYSTFAEDFQKIGAIIEVE